MEEFWLSFNTHPRGASYPTLPWLHMELAASRSKLSIAHQGVYPLGLKRGIRQNE
jgi:hypothetical protein